MYHLEHILYILAIFIGPAAVMIWTIVGRPRIIKPKQWRTPPAVSAMLSADVAEEIRASLDECEQSIS